MGTYKLNAYREDIFVASLVLDSNVLVAAFDSRDDHHEDAKYVIENWDSPFIISMSVVVESWGVLVGKRKGWLNGTNMLQWINTPGSSILVPQDSNEFDDYTRMVLDANNLDTVDVLLAHLTDDITTQCRFDENLRIATYDTKDFLLCREKFDLRLRIFDMRDMDEY